MKAIKLLSIIFLSALAASSAFATNKYFTSGSAVFSNNGSWYLDEERTQAGTVPSYDDDAYFIKTGTAWVTQTDTYVNNLVTSNTGNVSFGKEILSNGLAYFEAKGKIKAQIAQGWAQFTFGTSFDAVEGSADVEFKTTGIEIGTEVYGNAPLSSYGETYLYFNMTDSRIKSSLLTVDGNIDMGGATISDINKGIVLNLGVDKTKVTGVLNMNINGWGYSNIMFQKSSILEVGGINTTKTYGDYTIANKSDANFNTTVVLKNAAKTDYMFVGTISDTGQSSVDILPDAIKGVTNITMDGEGTQRIFTAIKGETILYKRQSGVYAVKSGKLMFENSRVADGYRLASLSIEGGKFGTAHYDTSNVGRVYLKTADFKSGGFAFENFAKHNSLETQISDKIVISDTFTKTGAGKISVDFSDKDGKDLDLSENILGASSDYADIENWVEILTSGSLSGFNLDPIVSQSVYDANADFEATGIYNAEAVFVWVANVVDGQTKGYSLQVGFVQVPEPATVATILGVLALGFVAYRKSHR